MILKYTPDIEYMKIIHADAVHEFHSAFMLGFLISDSPAADLGTAKRFHFVLI